MIRRLSGRDFSRVADQRGQHLLGALVAQRIEPQLAVVGLAAPFVTVLGAVVNQQQNLRGADRIGEQIEQLLGLFIDPVQVLENYNQRLVEALADAGFA